MVTKARKVEAEPELAVVEAPVQQPQAEHKPERNYDFAIKRVAAIPGATRAVGPDRPLDPKFDDMENEVYAMMKEGVPPIAEIFVPQWFFEDRRPADSTAKSDPTKMRENVKRWFAGWQKRKSAREKLKMSTIWRKGTERGSEYTEPGVSAFMTKVD